MKELIPESWAKRLKDETDKDYFRKLDSFLEKEYQDCEIYPPRELVFEALRLTPFEDVKVVIIGQDPYHGQGQAHGLAFSVKKGVKIPPSLRNIFKELCRDLGVPGPDHGNLEHWAKQGVLLLNAVLTVKCGEAGSQQKKGWEQFTDKIVDVINEEKQGLVFLLWGRHAQKKGARIDREKHLVLESAHPSPLSARKFFGCGHFSKVNEKLNNDKKQKIDF